MSRADREASLSLGAALVAAVVAVTCHRGTRLDVPEATAGPDPRGTASPSARTVPEAARGALPVARSSSTAPARTPGSLALGRLNAALAALESKARTQHVRILWYGDSHTAADYLTGAFRRRLEARFGSGGPGFLRVGTSPYRHDGVRVIRDGKWKIHPEPPARRTPEGDGMITRPTNYPERTILIFPESFVSENEYTSIHPVTLFQEALAFHLIFAFQDLNSY
jgi:hypothetical protein